MERNLEAQQTPTPAEAGQDASALSELTLTTPSSSRTQSNLDFFSTVLLGCAWRREVVADSQAIQLDWGPGAAGLYPIFPLSSQHAVRAEHRAVFPSDLRCPRI